MRLARHPYVTVKARARAHGSHKAGEMNSYEREYAELFLDKERAAGEITAYWFEHFTLKLGEDCRYTPDFLVQLADGTLECREVKGSFVAEDAKVKLAVAPVIFPIFTFKLCVKLTKKEGGGWKITTLGGVE